MIRDGSVHALVDKCLEHIGLVAVEPERLMRLRFRVLLAAIQQSITKKDKTERQWQDRSLLTNTLIQLGGDFAVCSNNLNSISGWFLF